MTARMKTAARFLTGIVTATLAAATMAAATGASSQLSKPQYIARADTICAAAHGQIVRLAPLGPLARTAKIGDRWLAIDRAGLRRLHALTPPAADRATIARTLTLADRTVEVGLLGLVRAAKSGATSAYAAAGARFGILLRASHAAAARYGESACSNW